MAEPLLKDADADGLASPVNDNDGEVSNPGEAVEFLEVGELRTKYIDYVTAKTDEIEEARDSRRRYHGSQYTAEQIKVLRRRHQPPIVWNRTARKINQIVGVVERLRSDPKALPRHPRSEQGADLATQVVRSVLDANDAKGWEPECLMQMSIDGIAGTQLVMTKDDMGQPDIGEVAVLCDEFFYDPTSILPNFDDATFQGVAKWVSLDIAQSLFPSKKQELAGLIQADSDMSSNPDRDIRWVITSQKRIRLVEIWYLHKGNWCWCFFVANTKLDEGLSPFYDEKNHTRCSYNMVSAAVDQDGDRYSFIRNLNGPQDTLNGSKSKALHLANSRRMIAEKGAVDDVEKARIELARPDGWIEKNPGTEMVPDDRPQDLAAFSAMAESASQEIEGFANINVAVLSGASLANISGRAIELLKQPGLAELGPFILSVRRWKLRRYRMIWTTAQRHWTTEKWLRVMDDESQKPLFIQLNGLSLDAYGRPVLVNALGALDVDIVMEEGPDVATLMQETNDMLKGYPPGTFPPQVIIESSQLPRTEKNKLLKMLSPPPPNPQAAARAQALQEQAAKLQLEGAAAKNAKMAADARRSDAAAAKSLHDAQQGASATQLDAAEFQHRVWTDALQMFQPQPQPGQNRTGPDNSGQSGQGGPQPQPQAPPQAMMHPEVAQALMGHVASQARRAPDGHHYVRDQSGRHYRVVRH